MEDGKPLVVQYETKLQKGLECGGAYVKLLSLGGEQEGEEFSDKVCRYPFFSLWVYVFLGY